MTVSNELKKFHNTRS